MYPLFAFGIDWWQGCDYPQSAASRLHFIGSQIAQADHYQCLGLLLSSPTLPACVAPGSTTCFPIPSPSQGSYKPCLSYLNLLLSINSQETEWGKATQWGKCRGRNRNREERKRGDSMLEREDQIKADISQVWHRHRFLCYQSIEPEENQTMATVGQPRLCLSTPP